MTPLCLRVCVRTCLCVCVCEKRERMGGRRGEPGSSLLLPPFNPYTSSPLSLSPPPLKCHVALSTRLPCYPPPPNKPFVRQSEEALRLGERDGVGWGGRASACCWLVVSDLWEHLLNIRRAGGASKSAPLFTLLSCPLSPQTSTLTLPQFQPISITCAFFFFASCYLLIWSYYWPPFRCLSRLWFSIFLTCCYQ